MQDQNSQANSQTQSQDDFYNDVAALNVSKDELNAMAALTQAESDVAENATNLVQEMKDILVEEKSQE